MDVVEAIVNAGADGDGLTDITNDLGQTPYDAADQQGHVEVTDYLNSL